MLFRPINEDLEQTWGNDSQSMGLNNQIQESQSEWQFFHPTEETSWNELNQASWAMTNDNAVLGWDVNINNIVPEEVKSPDLSELLKESSVTQNNQLTDAQNLQIWLNSPGNNEVSQSTLEQNENTSNWTQISEDNANVVLDNELKQETQNGEKDDWLMERSLDIWKVSDEERVNIVSNIEWSIHSNLDLLVDNQRINVINKYKMIHRIVFKRWLFFLSSLCGILAWVVLQVDASGSHVYKIIKEWDINNLELWNNNSESLLWKLKGKWVDVKTLVPYWSAKINWNSFLSRSNLLSYNGIILPQVSYIDYQLDDFSLENFNNQNFTREDLESLLDSLVMSESIYKMTKDLPWPSDFQTLWQTPHGWLVDWFSLGCLTTHKFSDFLCDNILHIFYKYGKYYNLQDNASELLSLTKVLRKHNEDIEPICQMVKEYTWHSWVWYDDNLNLVMNYCSDEDKSYYKKMTNFIEAEKSLNQPQIPNKVFDDSDVNAYKLISAWQSVYKILDGTSLNKNYIISYLNFVQELINKDKGTNKYLDQVYKDLLYIFNNDELYNTLLLKWELSSDIKSQIDQINNWNSLYGYKALSEYVTNRLVESWSSNVESVVKTQTIEQIFSQYYSMNDHLKIKKAEVISGNKIGTQTEIFSDKILKVTGWETLKATVVLYRKDNVLYIDSIKIATQQWLTDILNIRASQGNVTFYAMIAYIDEQIELWYDRDMEDAKPQWNFCDDLEWVQSIDIYSCDESSIVIYKWDIEYNFSLNNWSLNTFDISNKEIDGVIRDRLSNVMMTKDNTPIIIKSVLDFQLDEKISDDNMAEKLQIVNQFRINLKLVPEITEIKWKTDEFLVEFVLWDINLQAKYNINTHMLTDISYVACDKTLIIRNLTIEVSANNEKQLTEIINNPRVFFTRANQAAYRKYLRMCSDE